MNIAIIDADLVGRKKHRFPNLACMKISAYNKQIGNNVTLVTDYYDLFSEYIDLPCDDLPNFNYLLFNNDKKNIRYYKEESIIFDKIIISKVFTDTEIPIQIQNLSICEYGGTGFFYDKAIPLPNEIEHHMPDYHLYDEWVNIKLNSGGIKKDFSYYLDHSIGFLTKGCFRQCAFCINKNSKKVEMHSPLNEFVDDSKKYICMLDDNFLGYPQWKDLILELQQTGKRFQFKQGLDERILTDDKCKMLSESKYYGDYIFAFDNIEDKELIEGKLKMWKEHYNTKAQSTKFYVFCGFDRNDKWDEDFWKQDIIDTFERIKILMRYNCLPYIMRFERYKESPYAGTYINFARWCNQPSFFKKTSYRKYCEMNQERTKTIICSAMRYLNKLEEDYPEIAKEYFDMRFEDVVEY